MAENSGISWTTHTMNPWRGCTKVSPGCANCYAEAMSLRNPKVLGKWGPQGTRVLAAQAQWALPEKWEREAAAQEARTLVFCASIADVFEDWAGPMLNSQEEELFVGPDGMPYVPAKDWPLSERYTMCHARARLWDLIRATPHLRWQLLTKRPQNIAKMMPHGHWPNVWLGVSVESQDWRWRIDALNDARKAIMCPVGFVSAEPLLGPLEIWDQLPTVQWLIIGGESGYDARSMSINWARSIMAQCREAGTKIFVKQLGRRPSEAGLRLLLLKDESHGAAPSDWPLDLCIQEFPD